MPIRRLFQKPPQAPAAGPWKVGPTPPGLRPLALSAATGQPVANLAAFERRAAARNISLSMLWSAHAGDGHLDLSLPIRGETGQVAAAVLVVPSPGRTGSVMFSSAAAWSGAPGPEEVLQAAVRQMAHEGTLALLQCLLAPGDQARARILERGGFRRLARLAYLERPNKPPSSSPPSALPPECRLEAWSPRDTALMIWLLERTFIDTLDCPGLSAMRQGADILAGHMHAGDGDTRHWRVLYMHDVPVGALLLSPCTAADSVDIIYLGLAPEARGKGLGTLMLTHGLHHAATLGLRDVQLAVDTANEPAVRLYRRAGFRPRQQREAWVCPLSSAPTSPH